MNTIDFRPYAVRITDALPGRFRFVSSSTGNWWIEKPNTSLLLHSIGLCDAHVWAFIGPLAEELGAWPDEGTHLIEAVAEAVCRQAEAMARVGA